MRLGNGLWEHALFNARLQPREIGLGSTGATSTFLKLEYTYGVRTGGVLDPAKNNGNVESQRIVASAAGLDVTQYYTYDQVNRLKEAKELLGGSEQWKQVYEYDRYGNRAVGAGSTLVPSPSLTPQALSDFDGATNRIRPAAMPGFGYDAAGNLTADALTGANGMVYDGEGRMVSYTKMGATTTYEYDGEGRRVKKVAGGVTTIFVYNVEGQMIAEYSDPAPAPTGETKYLTADHLGSTRVITDQSQAVVARHDYLPFGEEVGTIGGRGSVPGYAASDTTRQRFTGHERDGESELDFMQARYCSPAQGRFTSPDFVAGDRRDPQQLNLYSYTRNNPLKYVDPTGNFITWPFLIDGQQGQGTVVPPPPVINWVFLFLFGDYIEDPGDAGNDVFQGLRGLGANIINPGSVGAAHEVGIADTNLVSFILRGANPLELGVPSTTRLVLTPTIRAELLATGGFTEVELDAALQVAGIESRAVDQSRLVNNLWEIAGIINEGGLSTNPATLDSQLRDATILGEAKTLGLPIFTNNVKDFNTNAVGGGTLARRLGVDIIPAGNLNNLKPRVFPRLTDAIKTLAKTIIP